MMSLPPFVPQFLALLAAVLAGSQMVPAATAADCQLYPWACQSANSGTGSPSPSSGGAGTASTQAAPAAAAPAPSAGGCQFILGFASLHSLDPADIGDCQDNQAFAGNGDAQQHTTKGLMAWRKADNWTAFTNGYMTWINGPGGLVSRLNTQRCSFEGDAASFPAASCGAASAPASQAPAQQAPAAGSSGCLPGIAGAYEKYTSHAQNGVAPRNGAIELLTLGADCSWQLNGGAKGTWSVDSIQAADVKYWGGQPSGSTTKITFNGWPGSTSGTATGPVEMSGSSPNFVWGVYDSGTSLGQMQMRYEYNSNPCGPQNAICTGSGGGSNLAETMMRIEAAQGAANISL